MTETVEEAPIRRGVPLWIQLIVWAVVLGLLAIVAFGLNLASKGTIQTGSAVPDFQVTLFDGYAYKESSAIKLSELRGKVVVLNFWASWCKPCEQEAADLEAAWRFYQPGDKVVFLGVDYTDTPTPAQAYLQKFQITYPNSPDLGSRVSQLFRIKGVPETYFIDQQGILRNVQIGPFSSEAQIRQMVDALLGQ